MSNVDLELRKAFQELQLQMVDSRDKIRQIDMQIELSKRSANHSRLTQSEIIALPNHVKTYESIGRMFVMRDPKDIHKLLNDKIEVNNEKTKTMEVNKHYLETTIKESENNLRELIAQKKLNK